MNANTLYVAAILFSRSTLHRETLPCLPNTRLDILFLSFSDDVHVTMVQSPRILVNTTSIFLRWSLLPILSDAPVARYEISYKRLENLPVDGTSIMNNFTLSNLLPATEYTVSITVVYDLGNSATATSSPVTVTVTTNAPGMVEYWIVHYSPVEYWIVHYSPVEYWIILVRTVEHWIVLVYTVEHWIVLVCTVEHWIVLVCTVEHWIVLVCTIEHWIVYYSPV